MGAPAFAMFLAQLAYAGSNIVYKLATKDGMSMRVLVAYRLIFGAAFMIPIAFVVERKKRPKLTWLVLFQFFLLGLLGGSLYHNLYVASLNLTSMTFAAAIYNLSPAFTFVVALFFKMETLSLTNARGLAKVFGTAVCIGGAMVLTFYKGIKLWHGKINLLHSHHILVHREPSTRDQVLGLVLALIACVCYSFWMILQAKVSVNYPCFYSGTALMSLMGGIQAVIFAVCYDRKWSDWRLGLSSRLVYAIYSGVFASGISIVLMAWCINKRGPLFAAIFSPLVLLFVTLAQCLFFEEKLYLGSTLGGILIIGGLYAVLWGKSNDAKQKNCIKPLPETVPANVLVPSRSDESMDRV